MYGSGLIVAFIAVEAATVNPRVHLVYRRVRWGSCVCNSGCANAFAVAVFILVSALLLALLRPLLKNICASSPPEQTPTGCSDREALVTEDIDNLPETGAIRINGVLWTARASTIRRSPAAAAW